MVPGAILALLLVVAAGSTLTVVGVLRLLEGPGAAESGLGASPTTGAASDGRLLVPLPTPAPTPTPNPTPLAAPTPTPTAAPSPEPAPTAAPTASPTPQPAPTTPPVIVQANENRIAEVYERLVGSVVQISAWSGAINVAQPYNEAGSGFIIDEEGHILTNYHVVEGARDLQITYNDGTRTSARVIGADPGSDVALLRASFLPPDKLVVAPLGSSDALKVGDEVITISSPFYVYRNSLSDGIVTGLGRTYAFSGRTITGIIQTGASINPGSSGGPLIDLREGVVVGINTAIQSRTFAGIALALPIDRVKAILPDLMAGRTPTHAWLPIHGADITPQLAAQCNLPVDYGVIVYDILPGSTLNNDTFTTGVNGDIIVSIDDRRVDGIADLSEYLDAHKKPGDIVELRIYRDRRINRVLEVTLEEWPNRDVPVLTQVAGCSRPTSEPINAPTVPPISADTSTNAASGKFIISAEPLMPAMPAATIPNAAPAAMPATMPRAARRSDELMAAVSARVA